MSNLGAVNVHSAVASSIVSLSTQTEEEKLFHEALQNVKTNKQQSGSISSFLQDLNQSRTIEDVGKAFERERAANALWREQSGQKWRKKAEKLATTMLKYKEFVDDLVQINSAIGGPVWGAITFVLGVIKDFSRTDELLDDAKSRLIATMERFQDYYRPGEIMQGSLRSALLRYYELVIGFVVDLQSRLAQNIAGLLMDVVHRTVKEVIEPFLQKLLVVTSDVDASATSKGFNRSEIRDVEIIGKLNAIQARLNSPSPPNPAILPGTKSFAYGVPTMLLSKSFKGQRQYLWKIHSVLRSHTLQQNQVSLYGIGGIGKTQILLKYVVDHHPRSNNPQAYRTIIWINAANTSDIAQTIQSFLRDNALGGDHLQHQDYASIFKAWLRDAENWLIVLDNVEEKCVASISKILPDGDHGHILCSTRQGLVALQLSRNADPVEILPMLDDDAIDFAKSLAQSSNLEQDRTDAVAVDVVRAAKGLPLVIEQIIHNAIFSNNSIEQTLDSIRDKRKLLEMQNFASLHGVDSDVGAVMQQSMEVLRERSPQAEALYKLLVYWKTSSISIQMILSGVKKLPEYLDRKHTFDRGHVEKPSDSVFWNIEPIDNQKRGSDSSFQVVELRRWRDLRGKLRLGRGRSKSPQPDLPMDSTRLEAELRNACGSDRPLGQLFKDEVNIRDALRLLRELSLISFISNDLLWIHDVNAAVTQGLIEKLDISDAHLTAATAATLVFLALPLPTTMDSYRRFQKCLEYLPHAIASHDHLNSFGILNDIPLGPELSHMIASAICRKSTLSETWTAPADSAGTEHNAIRAQKDGEKINEVIKYYELAVRGYSKSLQRVNLLKEVSETRVIASIVADEQRGGMSHTHYHMDCQRFGRSAHWRMLQTSLRLSRYYQMSGDEENLAKAIAHNTICLHLYERIFGISHDFLLCIRETLHSLYTALGRHEDAYQVTVQGIRNFLKWNDIHPMPLGVDEHGDLSYSQVGAVYCREAGHSCLELPERNAEAPVFFYVWLRYAELTGGKEHYTCRKPMQALGRAYEMLGDRSTSIYWWARSVLCILSVLEWEPMISDPDHEYHAGPWIGAFLHGEETMRETVRDYEQARIRLGSHSDQVLHKFLERVDLRIKIWRADRERNGSPYSRAEEEFTGELPEWMKVRMAKWGVL